MRNDRPDGSLESYRRELAINPDNLSQGLVDQPELFDHVSEQFILASAERDRLKLELEEAMADLDKQFRLQAHANEEKLTDTACAQLIKAAPKIREIQRELLEARKVASLWGALKDSYEQRSYMLRELVQRELAQMRNLGLQNQDRLAITGDAGTLAVRRVEEGRRRLREARETARR